MFRNILRKAVTWISIIYTAIEFLRPCLLLCKLEYLMDFRLLSILKRLCFQVRSLICKRIAQNETHI